MLKITEVKMNVKYILVIILLSLFGIFIVQNTESVTVKFLMLDAMLPRAILLLLTLAVGILIGIFIPYQFKKHK